MSREVLWEAIRADPEDDTVRLVYADWLSDRGEEEHASLIRTQLRRTQLPVEHPDRVTLELQEWSLWRVVHAIRSGLKDVATGVGWGDPHRGFVDRVYFGDPLQWAALGPRCLDRTVVDHVVLPWARLGNVGPLPAHERLRELSVRGTVVDVSDVEWLAASPILSTVKRLNLVRSDLRDEHLRVLLGSPHLGELQVLRVPYNHLGDDAIEALVERDFEGLVELDLSTTTFDDFQSQGRDALTMTWRGAERLAEWPGLFSVQRLNLDGQQIGTAGLTAVLQSVCTPELRHLSVRGISDWDRGAGDRDDVLVGFAQANPELGLVSLSIGDCELTEDGAAAVASSPVLSQLRILRMGQIREPWEPAFQDLGSAAFFEGLAVLHVDQITGGDAFWSRVLARESQWLHTLSVSSFFHWAREDDLLQRLATGPVQPALRCLEVVDVDLSTDSLLALGHTQSLPALERLAISGLGYGSRRTSRPSEYQAQQLRGTPLAARLTSLELGHRELDRLPRPESDPDG
ncbi:MAG: TIGR02996 domain-containing protein [Myxococcales bacterium]|nr:TIGR02996 domain-containing protein [Myxococcales bacterium]